MSRPQEKAYKPKYLPDTYQQVASTTDGQMVSLARAFRERIALVKRARR